MVKLKTAVVYLIILGCTLSCSFLSKGYDNEYGQFLPKRPKFSLKDKEHHRIPPKLITMNIYKLNFIYDDLGMEIYPSNYIDSYGKLKYSFYMKFYRDGRCSFLGGSDKIKNSDLISTKSSFRKDYFFSRGNQTFQIESFVNNKGYEHCVKKK